MSFFKYVGQQGVMPAGAQPRAISNGPAMAAAAGATPAGQPRGPASQAPPTYKFTAPQMRAPAQGMPGQTAAVHIQGQEPLSASALAAAHPNDQKQMLGERLFPLIHVSSQNITNMVLGVVPTVYKSTI
jgi:polyadenylate-binding protein